MMKAKEMVAVAKDKVATDMALVSLSNEVKLKVNKDKSEMQMPDGTAFIAELNKLFADNDMLNATSKRAKIDYMFEFQQV